MEKMQLAFITFTTYALLASAVAAKTCEEQKAHCDELDRDEESYLHRLVPENGTQLWPVSAADLKQLQATADQFCRWNVDVSNCRKSLYAQCPALLKDDGDWGGWYGAEFRLSLGTLCSTTVGPVKYFRAIAHCIDKDEDALDGCCEHLDTAANSGENDSASVAHQSFLQQTEKECELFDGAHDVAVTCGQDAEQTLKDAFKQVHTAYCKK